MMIMTDQPLTFSVGLGGIIAHGLLVLKVIGLTLLAAAIAAVALPPIYESRASFVTSSSSSKMANALGSGSIGGLQGLATQLGVSAGQDPSESPNFYAKLIASEELRRRLLNSRFHDPRSKSLRDSAKLLDILRIRNDDSVRRMEIGLKKMEKSVEAGYDLKTNMVELVVTSRWSELAAAIAARTIEL